jgi:hypothetical protein
MAFRLKRWLIPFAIVAMLLLEAQPPPPGGAAIATAQINVLVNGQLVGSAAQLNLFVTGASPSGIVGSCVPNSTLSSTIDCTWNLGVLAPTFNQIYANPLYCASTNGTIIYGCYLNAHQGTPTVGLKVDLVADTTCATACSLNLDCPGGQCTGTGNTITQSDGTTAPNGAIVAGQMKELWFDGTVFRII